MQTDPIGYEDQINLYAYVGNDPFNYNDPSGMCKQDASGAYSGLCAMDKGAAAIISNSKSNPNSAVSGVDAQLEGSGKAAYVQTGSTDLGGNRVDGAVTETVGVDNQIVVTIDTKDTVQVDGVNTATGQAESRDLTTAEVFEHEVAGHVQDAINTGTLHPRGVENGVDMDEKNAMQKENDFRKRSGINFERTEYRGRVR